MPDRDEAALARNWWRILLVDVSLGLATVVLGVWRMASGAAAFGVVVAAAGSTYVALVLRRAGRWRRLRAAAARPGRRPPGPPGPTGPRSPRSDS